MNDIMNHYYTVKNSGYEVALMIYYYICRIRLKCVCYLFNKDKKFGNTTIYIFFNNRIQVLL